MTLVPSINVTIVFEKNLIFLPVLKENVTIVLKKNVKLVFEKNVIFML